MKAGGSVLKTFIRGQFGTLPLNSSRGGVAKDKVGEFLIREKKDGEGEKLCEKKGEKRRLVCYLATFFFGKRGAVNLLDKHQS